jgi:hypothetical protein
MSVGERSLNGGLYILFVASASADELKCRDKPDQRGLCHYSYSVDPRQMPLLLFDFICAVEATNQMKSSDCQLCDVHATQFPSLGHSGQYVNHIKTFPSRACLSNRSGQSRDPIGRKYHCIAIRAQGPLGRRLILPVTYSRPRVCCTHYWPQPIPKGRVLRLR